MSMTQSIVDPGLAAEPGRGPEVLTLLQAAAAVLDEVPGAMHQLGDAQEDELVSVLLRLHGRSAQVATVVTADAVDRGTVDKSDAANTKQWLTGHLASGGVPVEPKHVHVMAAVADACQVRKNLVVAQALVTGSCSVQSARSALTQADKIAPVIPTAHRDEILGWFVHLDPALGTDGLTTLTRKIIDRYAPEKLSDNDEKLESTESLSWSTTATGMTRLIADLSPANAAILKEAINANSAPAPAKPAEGTGETSRTGGSGASFGLGADSDNAMASSPGSGESVRDERSAGKRRVDALLDLVGAGARAATGDGIQAGAATVLLTMGLQDLLNGHGASTVTGDVIDAGVARRLACTADLIPAVLGGPSQPLDVGRRERLATKAIRAAVILRDGGCTFPGCDRPPGFCEIHHIRPWWTGGETSLGNSTLLCGRHHQTTHRHGYTAEVRPDGVIWDLTPGQMAGHNTTAA